EGEALGGVARRSKGTPAQQLQHPDRVVQRWTVDPRLVVPPDSGESIERPIGRAYERPAQPTHQNGSEVDAGELVAFELFARHQPDDRRQLTLALELAEIAFRRFHVVCAHAHRGRGGLELPDKAAAMRGEVGADR